MDTKRCSMCRAVKPLTEFYDQWVSHCKECHKAICRQYYAKNREMILEKEAYRAEEKLARAKEWNRQHPGHQSTRQRGCTVRDLTLEQWEAIKAAYKQKCAYCGKKRKLAIEHVIPIARGGNHTASNVVPSCRSCNARKHRNVAPLHQKIIPDTLP